MHSMRNQVAALFIGLLFLSIVAISAINMIFLERYYISKKTEVLLEAMDALETLDLDAVEEDTARDYEDEEEAEFSDGTDAYADVPDEMRTFGSKKNLTWVVMGTDTSLLAYVGDNPNMLRNRLFGYAYDLDMDSKKNVIKVLEENDSYIVQQVHDRFANMDYVECWGNLSNGDYFLIRTPLESIRESVAISNNFYFFVGAAIILISGLFIWILTNKITKPISELTRLSQQMTDLDFDARYECRAGNEIDVLGDNFNKMCSELEKNISELKSANNKLQKDIQDKIKIDQMRKEFLDNVSHELKTPIALIQGYAEGLKENISEDPESREFYCDVIIDESAKMNKLVKNLLTLNQLESGKDAAVMERFDIVSLIRGVLGSMEILIQQKEAKVIFEATKPVYVWADEFKIEEVVTNYTSNALNHLAGDRQIEINVWKEDDRVKVTVFNTGYPIPEEDLPNLWNKFYKVDKARTREYGGSGIGLSIVKAIMEGLNQEYGVQNYDNGVEFWFTLDRK
ncbi:MAG: HAMP domain-containing sensor histidine kinase [Eubacteriales bacterium]|nr:HAMP domain-containing sensor histidine kinase [Eubacteriales bacterium]